MTVPGPVPNWPYPTSACSLCGLDLVQGDEFIPLTQCRYDGGPKWRDNTTVVLVHTACLIKVYRHGEPVP